ncbi:MAG: 16S rRNA (guanine(527)-N(7))-methyltransferase RsmG [Eubacteriales bacterium]
MTNENEFETLFREVFHKNGLDGYISEKTIRLFSDLTDRMIETNRVMNITALTTPEKIIPLHYADCALIAGRIPKNARVADVGCGGGFPTLPLAILRPDLTITAIDSTEKKVRYVAETAKALGLSIQTCAGRAEELAGQADFREQFDLVVSRAVARQNILNELSLPLVKVGGQLLTMKGAGGEEEYREAMNSVRLLGGGQARLESYTLYLTDGEEKRTVITVQKETHTDGKYPRPFGKIKKNPL